MAQGDIIILRENAGGTYDQITISGIGTPSFGEVPSGTVNGTNTDFTTANTPITGTVRVYVQGYRMAPTDDYTISGNTITFVLAPLTGSKILVDYNY